MFGIALRGFGKALKSMKKDPTTPVKIKPTTGKKQTEKYLKKLKGKK
jgi:hypothetical protein